jgi:predicted nucleic acid-binding protein
MIVVADTSPLNYLIQVNCESLLPSLYKRVLIPVAVLEELADPAAPAIVSLWLLHVPEWIEVRKTTTAPDTDLSFLDPGERQAIQLATEQGADLLLIDERRGRVEATRRGLATTGTLGVLLTAAERGAIDAAAVFHQLTTKTNFRATPELRRSFLQKIRAITKKGT